jgi:hypothetical protein
MESAGTDDQVPESAERPSEAVRPSPAPGGLARLGEILAGRAPVRRPAASSTGQAVNGLDEREWRLSVAAGVLALGLVIAGYLVNRHSHVEKVRSASATLLIAGVVIVVIMFAGAAFRRRALVGFASFMAGFELITGGNVFGILFLFFGGWLLVRALKRQRADKAAQQPSTARQRAPDKRPPTPSAGPPKASKRYTPPRKSRAAARRR